MMSLYSGEQTNEAIEKMFGGDSFKDVFIEKFAKSKPNVKDEQLSQTRSAEEEELDFWANRNDRYEIENGS